MQNLHHNGRGWILLAVAAGWFLSIGVRLIYPAVLPYIRTDFGLDLTTAGLLLTVLWTVYALGQFPGGVLADRIGPGTVLIASTTLSTLTLMLVSVSSTIGVLFGATALLGLSTALYGPARLPLLSAVFPDQNGTAIGITQATGNLGNTLLPPIAGIIAGALIWQFGFAVLLPLFAGTAIALWWVVPRDVARPGTPINPLSINTLRYLLAGVTERSVLVVTAIQVLGSFTFQGFTGFYPTYLIEVKGLSPDAAAGLFGLFFATGILIQPLTGMAGDRIGEKRALVAVAVAIMLTLAALPFITQFWALVVITVALGSLLGRAVLALTYLTNALPEDIRGTGLGLLRSSYILVGATSPVLIGVLADANYFDEAFLLLAAIGGVMVLFCLVLPARS